MRPVLKASNQPRGLLLGCAAATWALVVTATALGQTVPRPTASSGLAASTAGPLTASQTGGLDMDVNPVAPLDVAPTVGATLRDNIQTGISPAVGQLPSTTFQPAQPADNGQASGAVTTEQATPEPVSLDRPTVVDTATFQSGGTTVALFGVEGVKGEVAEGLQGFLTSHGNRITCQAQSNVDFVCLQPDGTDVAEVALVNGAARAKTDAPDSYRNQELAAQNARRGIWANLPPPPATIRHPEVRDTATLVADGQVFVLDGLQGLGAPFTEQLQAYIGQHGDSLKCDPQVVPGHYVCLMSDDTDIAKVALVNGAAQVAPDAPDTYRVQQAEALNNRRGFWQNQSQQVLLLANSTVTEQPTCCAFVPGDDGVDGVAYVGGVPTAVIEGETVFITYVGDAGWGYYDHSHHWRAAPSRYWSHMEHYHPYGHGLRGYAHEDAFRREAAFRPGGIQPGGGHPGGFQPGGIHPGVAGPGASAFRPGAGMRPAVAEPGVRPGMAGPGMHPAMAAPGMHTAMGGPAMHPAMAEPGMHAGMAATAAPHSVAPGAGFIHPGPSAAGFHPGGMAAAAHAAPAVAHVSAPSVSRKH